MPLGAAREIPFNYTSADDQQVVTLLLGADAWDTLERLRGQRVTAVPPAALTVSWRSVPAAAQSVLVPGVRRGFGPAPPLCRCLCA